LKRQVLIVCSPDADGEDGFECIKSPKVITH
jgi:hypothetical protein